MEKQQIIDHIRRIEEEELREQEEQLFQASAPPTQTTALVPVSHQNTPPIVESTIVIETPLPEEEAEPISDIQPQSKRRGSLLLVMLTLLSLVSTGLYFLLPIFMPSATVTIMPLQKKLTTTATIHIAAQTNQLTANQIPGRLLPSFTLSQLETVKTTGIGHQAATSSQGYITFYNGLLVSQTVSAGTILTGRDGVQVITDQTAFLPAGNPPIYGQVTIFAHVIVPGRAGNIQAYDVKSAFSSSILAKNLQPFYGGKDARTYSMVSQADIDNVVTHLKPSLTQSIQGAFSIQLTTGEALITPHCVLKTGADHGVGEEAAQVQVSVSQTCQAAAYQQADLQQLVSHVVNQEAVSRFGSGYGLVGDMQISLASTALTSTSQQIAAVNINAVSQWVYQVGNVERQQMSKAIAGKSKQEAFHLLSHLNGIRNVTLNLVGGYNDILPQDAGRIQIVVIYRFV